MLQILKDEADRKYVYDTKADVVYDVENASPELIEEIRKDVKDHNKVVLINNAIAMGAGVLMMAAIVGGVVMLLKVATASDAEQVRIRAKL